MPSQLPLDPVVHHEPEGCAYKGRPHTGPCKPYSAHIDPALANCWVCGEPGMQEYQSSSAMKCIRCQVTWNARTNW